MLCCKGHEQGIWSGDNHSYVTVILGVLTLTLQCRQFLLLSNYHLLHVSCGHVLSSVRFISTHLDASYQTAVDADNCKKNDQVKLLMKSSAPQQQPLECKRPGEHIGWLLRRGSKTNNKQQPPPGSTIKKKKREREKQMINSALARIWTAALNT